MIPEKAFADLSVMTVADLLQLLPPRGKLIFFRFSDKDSMKHLLDLPLWYLFEHAELTGVARQNDKLFVHLLNKVRVGDIDDDVESCSWQYLYMNLTKTIQKIPCTCS